jgi:ATP-dependent Clp protease ATP-binding subunit ClpA
VLTPEIEKALQNACILAQEMGHTEVTVQHVLIGVMEAPVVATHLTNSGCDLGALRTNLRSYLSSLPTEGGGESRAPTISIELQRAMPAAILKGQREFRVRAGKEMLEMTVDLLDLTDALIREYRTASSGGINKED